MSQPSPPPTFALPFYSFLPCVAVAIGLSEDHPGNKTPIATTQTTPGVARLAFPARGTRWTDKTVLVFTVPDHPWDDWESDTLLTWSTAPFTTTTKREEKTVTVNDQLWDSIFSVLGLKDSGNFVSSPSTNGSISSSPATNLGVPSTGKASAGAVPADTNATTVEINLNRNTDVTKRDGDAPDETLRSGLNDVSTRDRTPTKSVIQELLEEGARSGKEENILGRRGGRGRGAETFESDSALSTEDARREFPEESVTNQGVGRMTLEAFRLYTPPPVDPLKSMFRKVFNELKKSSANILG